MVLLLPLLLLRCWRCHSRKSGMEVTTPPVLLPFAAPWPSSPPQSVRALCSPLQSPAKLAILCSMASREAATSGGAPSLARGNPNSPNPAVDEDDDDEDEDEDDDKAAPAPAGTPHELGAYGNFRRRDSQARSLGNTESVSDAPLIAPPAFPNDDDDDDDDADAEDDEAKGERPPVALPWVSFCVAKAPRLPTPEAPKES